MWCPIKLISFQLIAYFVLSFKSILHFSTKMNNSGGKRHTFFYILYTIKIIIWGTKLQWVRTFVDDWHFTEDRASSDYLKCYIWIQVQRVSNTSICLHAMCKRLHAMCFFFLHGDKHFDTVYVYTLYMLTE